jgi:hypothetical protein
MIGKTELESLTKKSALGGRLTRGFTMAGFLSKAELESLLAGAVRTAIISGGPAGDHMVTGIEVGDALRAVIALDPAHTHTVPADTSGTTEVAEINAAGNLAVGVGGSIQSGGAIAPSDLTSEFLVTAANTINNAGGTDTTGQILVVVYEDLTP